METEVRLLPWLSEQVPLAIPNPCYVGSPSADYPCVFAGYPLIPGHTIKAAKVTDDERRAMARPLAQFLAALHSISPEEARVRGAAQDPIRRLDATRHRARAVDRVNALSEDVMPSSTKARLRFLLDRLPTIAEPSSDTLVHGDLHGSQILVDQHHEIAGVIDWGDVHLGDPASDFAVVHSILPRDRHEDFLDTYGAVDLVSWSAAKARAIWHTMAVVIHAIDVGDKATIREAQSCLIRLAED